MPGFLFGFGMHQSLLLPISKIKYGTAPILRFWIVREWMGLPGYS
jgi:hypothetical protein